MWKLRIFSVTLFWKTFVKVTFSLQKNTKGLIWRIFGEHNFFHFSKLWSWEYLKYLCYTTVIVYCTLFFFQKIYFFYAIKNSRSTPHFYSFVQNSNSQHTNCEKSCIKINEGATEQTSIFDFTENSSYLSMSVNPEILL